MHAWDLEVGAGATKCKQQGSCYSRRDPAECWLPFDAAVQLGPFVINVHTTHEKWLAAHAVKSVTLPMSKPALKVHDESRTAATRTNVCERTQSGATTRAMNSGDWASVDN